MPRLSPRVHNSILVLSCLALLPFIRLGVGELHSDEVIYASRAQEILARGELLPDVPLVELFGRQPPLVIWCMALAIRVLGFSSFSARLVSALSWSALLIGVFLVARRVVGNRGAIGAAALLAASPLLWHFSQMAQLDVPWLAIVTLSYAAFMRAWDGDEPKWMIVAGALCGFSFVAKLFVSVLPFGALIVWFVFAWRASPGERKKIQRMILRFVAFAVLVALPWHVWMILRYGREFFDVAIGYDVVARTLHGADAGSNISGKFFYLNQLLVDSPAIVFVLALAALRLRSWKQREMGVSWEPLVWLWLVIPFVALELMAGQMHSYAVQLLPPMIILAIAAVEDLMAVGISPALATVLGGAVITIAWGSSQSVRDGVRSLLAPMSSRVPVSSTPFVIAALLAAACVVAILLLMKFRPRVLQTILWNIPTYGVAALVLFRMLAAATDSTPMQFSGAKQIAEGVPANGSVLLLSGSRSPVDAKMQFNCYDRTKSLYKRAIFEDIHSFAAAPFVVHDSVHAVIVEKPDEYFVNDSSGIRSGANLLAQHFVVLAKTTRFDLYARGLLRDQ